MDKLNLLQIEDNVDDAILIQRILQKFGYQVEARRIDTALELEKALNEQPWDIVLSDYAMPYFDGIAALTIPPPISATIWLAPPAPRPCKKGSP